MHNISVEHCLHIQKQWYQTDGYFYISSQPSAFSRIHFPFSNKHQSGKTTSKSDYQWGGGGYQITTQEGDLDNFVTVWYNPQSLTNILSIVEFHKRCRVTMDMATEKRNFTCRANGTKMKFVESNSGLFYFETNNNSKIKFYVTDYTWIKTEESNKSHYRRCDI